MAKGYKRAGLSNYSSKKQRPKDKIIKNYCGTFQTLATTGWAYYQRQFTEQITCPTTVKGIRWNISAAFAEPQATDATACAFRWMIVLIKAGEVFPSGMNTSWPTPGSMDGWSASNTPTPTTGTGKFLFQPDERCLVHGSGMLVKGQQAYVDEGATKGMRKMNPGDALYIVIAAAANLADEDPGYVDFIMDLQFVNLC